MKEQFTNNKRIGQGKKIEDSIEATIVETLVSLWLSGKQRRQLSAEAVLDRISHDQPDIVDHLPSPQTVRRVIRPLKERLEEGGGYLDQPWSLGKSMPGVDGIDEDALPILLQINKHMALDVGDERRRNGFKVNRLTVREARWVSTLRKSLPSAEESDNEAPARGVEASVLLDLAKRYATRELVARILGEEMDTYDLDMEIAYNVPFRILLGRTKDSQLWMLSLELGLISHSPLSTPGEVLEHGLRFGVNDVSPMVELEDADPRIERVEAVLSMSLFQVIRRLEDNGIAVRVRFGTQDWVTGPRWQDIRSSSTLADYEINLDILRLILPLARIDREVTDSDPDQVRIATAFLKKIRQAIQEKLQDPKVREVLRPTRKSGT